MKWKERMATIREMGIREIPSSEGIEVELVDRSDFWMV